MLLFIAGSSFTYILFLIVSGITDASIISVMSFSLKLTSDFGERSPSDSSGGPLISTPFPPSLNDMTIELSPYICRPWLMAVDDDDDTKKKKKPPYKLLLTNFLWNSPKRLKAWNTSRTIRTRELLQSVVDHPYFDPHGWEDYALFHKPIDPSVRYYIFLDVETCYESNYPSYGHGLEKNLDRVGGRSVSNVLGNCYNIKNCEFIDQAFQSPLFGGNITSLLVFFDCRGFSNPRTLQLSTKLALVSISAETNQHDTSVDQGMPPPAVINISLSLQEVQDIEACNETNRKYYFTFVGGVRNRVRSALTRLNDPMNGVILLGGLKFRNQYQNMSYTDMLKQSQFAATPRGDNLFSYRFTEVLAAGAIPVVHSDGWVLPFRSELVNWTDCLLRIPEAQVNDTISILNRITPEKRCQMRKRCYGIYERYMATPQGNINGIIEGLELVGQRHHV